MGEYQFIHPCCEYAVFRDHLGKAIPPYCYIKLMDFMLIEEVKRASYTWNFSVMASSLQTAGFTVD